MKLDRQKAILNQYLKLNQQPTLKQISKDTGIQITRVFRLLNGQEMRLGEYEVFKTKILKNNSQREQAFSLMEECVESLSERMLLDLADTCQKLLQLNKLKTNMKTA